MTLLSPTDKSVDWTNAHPIALSAAHRKGREETSFDFPNLFSGANPTSS
jgi:hypothetical protein